ncbi:MAG: cytochrome c [Rhizobiaceae bacterium]|nr:cytochrome c [Rhizobiaceae bacterium]
MRSGVTLFASLLLAGSALADDAADVEYGRVLVLENCATCHAVDRVSKSTHPEAPPFRILSQRYPLEGLEEALGEGIVVGHPDMPEFIFTPPQIGGIIAYMKSISD